MRILDQVRLSQFDIWPTVQESWDHYIQSGVLSFNDAVPIDITNVYRWMDAEWSDLDTNTDQRGRLWRFCEGLRASFHNSWFEWRTSEIVTGTKLNRSVKVDARAIWASDEAEGGGWSMILFERQDGNVCATYSWTLDLDASNEAVLALLFPESESDEDVQAHKHFVGMVLSPVLLAQNLMHCKNVVVEGQPLPPKLAKSFQRKHKMRPASFRGVKIEPMKTVIKRAGGVAGIGTEKAMHIVRGNFAEYSDEKPLFGKVVGRFFRQQHIRGNADLGVKQPDYTVQPPKP